MKTTVASFGLATLSLITSYVIVAAWPDNLTADSPAIAQVAPIQAAPAPVASVTVVSLAE